MGEERFARVAVVPVLQDRLLDVLAGERVLEFGGAEGDAVEEEGHVDALLRLGAVAELADDGEEIGGVETAGLLVEAARRAEVGEVELAGRVLDSLAEDVQGAAPVEFPGEAVQEALADIGAVVLLEAVPGAWLCGYEEIDDVAGDEAEVAIVMGVGGAAVVAAGGEAVAVWGGGGFVEVSVALGAGVGAPAEEGALDGVLEGAFGGGGGGHGDRFRQRYCVWGPALGRFFTHMRPLLLRTVLSAGPCSNAMVAK